MLIDIKVSYQEVNSFSHYKIHSHDEMLKFIGFLYTYTMKSIMHFKEFFNKRASISHKDDFPCTFQNTLAFTDIYIYPTQACLYMFVLINNPLNKDKKKKKKG